MIFFPFSTTFNLCVFRALLVDFDIYSYVLVIFYNLITCVLCSYALIHTIGIKVTSNMNIIIKNIIILIIPNGEI